MGQPDNFFTVHQGDARKVSRLLEKVSSVSNPGITCTITSPPYGTLKDYGHPDQIGYGQPYEEYLVDCRRVFRSIFEHTKVDGTLWIVADTQRRPDPQRSNVWRMDAVPFDLAKEAEASGWILRDIIVWRKDKSLPWSGKGRLRNAFEYLLLLVKDESFKYRIDRLRDPTTLEEWWVKWPERYNPLGKVPTNVWDVSIPVQGSWGNLAVSHACPLPPDLVERLVLLSTDPGDIVFDPFAGSGTVVGEANRLGRKAFGFELNPDYVAAYETVMRAEFERRASNDRLAANATQNEVMRDKLLMLRALKYPKVLARAVADTPGLPPILGAVALTKGHPTETQGPYELVRTRTVFLSRGTDEELENLRRAVKVAADRRPASKMGVGGDLIVLRPSRLADLTERKTLYLYPRGHTWMADKRIHLKDIDDVLSLHSGDRFPPVFGDIKVQEVPRAINGGVGP